MSLSTEATRCSRATAKVAVNVVDSRIVTCSNSGQTFSRCASETFPTNLSHAARYQGKFALILFTRGAIVGVRRLRINWSSTISRNSTWASIEGCMLYHHTIALSTVILTVLWRISTNAGRDCVTPPPPAPLQPFGGTPQHISPPQKRSHHLNYFTEWGTKKYTTSPQLSRRRA